MAGHRLKDVKVEYKIYNYAEFFTAATRVTDSKGNATLKTGQGDMLAWATDGKHFGFAKIDSPHTTLVLDHPVGQTFETDMDIMPPVENPIPSKATKEDIEECARRFEFENTLRDSYAKTFYGEPYCTLSAAEVKERFGNQGQTWSRPSCEEPKATGKPSGISCAKARQSVWTRRLPCSER